MKLMRLLCWIMVFCIDVHVKAEETHKEKCDFNRGNCVILAEDGRRVFRSDEILVMLAPRALLEIRNENTVQLVKGDFYIETEQPVKLQTPYAKIWCEGECKGLFSRTAVTLEVKSLDGNWRITRAGEKTVYVVPAGLQVSIGEVAENGQAQMEFPQSLPWVPTIKQWASLYPGKVSEFKPELEKFRQVWREAVEAVSVLHQTVATRAVASHEAEVEQARRQRLAQLREDQGLRNLFRDKNP